MDDATRKAITDALEAYEWDGRFPEEMRIDAGEWSVFGSDNSDMCTLEWPGGVHSYPTCDAAVADMLWGRLKTESFTERTVRWRDTVSAGLSDAVQKIDQNAAKDRDELIDVLLQLMVSETGKCRAHKIVPINPDQGDACDLLVRLGKLERIRPDRDWYRVVKETPDDQ